jgi:hypothetical protein
VVDQSTPRVDAFQLGGQAADFALVRKFGSEERGDRLLAGEEVLLADASEVAVHEQGAC